MASDLFAYCVAANSSSHILSNKELLNLILKDHGNHQELSRAVKNLISALSVQPGINQELHKLCANLKPKFTGNNNPTKGCIQANPRKGFHLFQSDPDFWHKTVKTQAAHHADISEAVDEWISGLGQEETVPSPRIEKDVPDHSPSTKEWNCPGTVRPMTLQEKLILSDPVPGKISGLSQQSFQALPGAKSATFSNQDPACNEQLATSGLISPGDKSDEVAPITDSPLISGPVCQASKVPGNSPLIDGPCFPADTTPLIPEGFEKMPNKPGIAIDIVKVALERVVLKKKEQECESKDSAIGGNVAEK